jgi:NAD(P)-dependent dehydrogenase (short-subunit alcohol dehydrogenase family)
VELVALPAGWSAPADALRGRVVLVAGAAGGVGAAAARAAAAAGATVVLLGRRVKPLERLYDELVAAGAPQPAIYPLDLEGATPEDYATLSERIEVECGRLDGVVLAAARFTGLVPLAQSEPLDFARAVHVNLTAPWLLLQACLPLLARSDDPSLVFVLDDAARAGRAYWGGYGIAKQALAALAAMLASEQENSPLRVHGLLPPPLRTALRARAYIAEDPGTLPVPEVLAPAIVYLLGSDGRPARGRVLDLR